MRFEPWKASSVDDVVERQWVKPRLTSDLQGGDGERNSRKEGVSSNNSLFMLVFVTCVIKRRSRAHLYRLTLTQQLNST